MSKELKEELTEEIYTCDTEVVDSELVADVCLSNTTIKEALELHSSIDPELRVMIMTLEGESSLGVDHVRKGIDVDCFLSQVQITEDCPKCKGTGVIPMPIGSGKGCCLCANQGHKESNRIGKITRSATSLDEVLKELKKCTT